MVNKLEEEPRKYTNKEMLDNLHKGYTIAEEQYSLIVKTLKEENKKLKEIIKNVKS